VSNQNEMKAHKQSMKIFNDTRLDEKYNTEKSPFPLDTQKIYNTQYVHNLIPHRCNSVK
jgi:hypothetical protein